MSTAYEVLRLHMAFDVFDLWHPCSGRLHSPAQPVDMGPTQQHMRPDHDSTCICNLDSYDSSGDHIVRQTETGKIGTWMSVDDHPRLVEFHSPRTLCGLGAREFAHDQGGPRTRRGQVECACPCHPRGPSPPLHGSSQFRHRHIAAYSHPNSSSACPRRARRTCRLRRDPITSRVWTHGTRANRIWFSASSSQ